MIDHVSIGVRDVAMAKRFYDAALKPLGYTCLSEGEGSLGYGGDAVALWIGAAERPVPADEKSGLHFCFTAPTRKAVNAFHAAALKSGGRDNRQARAPRRLRPRLLRRLRDRSRRLPHRGPLRASPGVKRLWNER
jgi:catechol 2,3-dioxygenase-like lactoylglutathione lyase family enzyme